MTWHILVADDEPLNLEIIGEFLDDADYHLSFAENGEAAWSILLAGLEPDATPVDLIVLDRMMPVLDGFSLLKRVKADSRFGILPVIMQTAASSPEEVREGIEAGAYYYLTKPYQPEALHAIVRAALTDIEERRQANAATARHEDILGLMSYAEFDFCSLDQAHMLAGSLATLCPEPGMAALGLTELLINAIEHGNLGISYAEKKALRQHEGWESEIARRLAMPEFSELSACVRVTRDKHELVFRVEDQGSGFDWQRYMDFDPERAFDPNGRGIAMARQVSFSRITYEGRGNIVTATISLEAGAVSPAPTFDS
jgi:CheY-like chemotaxis protein